MTHVIDIFNYFAKFATKNAVLKNFTRGNEPTYQALKASFDTHTPIMDFDDYVFGHDKEQLYKRIQDVRGEFLFVEYSQINNTPGVGVKHGVLLTVLVGRKVDTKTIDGIDIAIIMDTCLAKLNQVCAQIVTDKREQTNRLIVDSSKITPYDTVDLSGAIGWSIDVKYEIPALWD